MVTTGGAPTVETIAERAGVSIASVSRVLNGHGARPETISRVERAAAEVGYVPNAVARSLKGGRTRQLTFAMQDIGNPVYVAMVRQIQAITKAEGYRLLLHSTDAVAEDELAVVRSLADRTSDGLILCPIRVTPEHVEALRTAAQPVVVIGSLPDEAPPVDSVRADSVTGAELAVRHLAATGRRRIAFVNGPGDTVPGRNRRLGYRRALEACGLPADPELEVTTEFTIEDGARSLHRLLDRARGASGSGGPGFDAVFCANDQLALGASQALHSRGLRIPGDVAVAGMDDTVLVRAGWPPLTSVDLGSAERGRIAAQMLLERISGSGQGQGTGQRKEPPPRVRTVTPRLVVRASSDPASDRAAYGPSAPGASESGASESGAPSPGDRLPGEVAP
ncbi:LacI family DNA-binding transcriptional regulator [Streptomyces marispadix]|uniref:LacI family transcriptional regulator n=1 Tax=Streptomyces marispadix TaxID=2922868 RepID=A0ABS9SU64_9ACTN|nr:LacI family DNA-binding transcriptional regulator [Streptomyces marispadix]MCH6159718.1 LacI family transcriptional regulator [Streptomyces marispadix]